MPQTTMSLFDPGALALVLAGTALACAARSGWAAFGMALGAGLRAVLGRGFKPEANRKALALALGAIARDGVRRADPQLPPDRALGLMLETFLRHGTLAAMEQARCAERTSAGARRASAAQVFEWAGELAPVFGLIGTLYGLTQLAPGSAASSSLAIMGAVSSAVLTSLYGALLAHLVCHPLASTIERRGLADEHERELLADWFTQQLAATGEPAGGRRGHLRGVA